MESFGKDSGGEHHARLHDPSHREQEVVGVRGSVGGSERESEQKDEEAGEEDEDEGLELVPPDLLEPQRLGGDHYPPRPFVHFRFGGGLNRGGFADGDRVDGGGGRGGCGFVHVGLSFVVPPETRSCLQQDHGRMGGRRGGGRRRGGRRR